LAFTLKSVLEDKLSTSVAVMENYVLLLCKTLHDKESTAGWLKLQISSCDSFKGNLLLKEVESNENSF